ncbi:hypothetical protein GCM10025868_20410 [Angustibacter aerolatus]|uniref:AMP-dependent synthetase/ligase domain-containing protein n=1 Tax=Angustibacter aerolatus TaxID=1162965 RepID=A0ABQ6JGX6_9ACTN|nr:AMP-binding protein [Angustibacter aerolatus]GMA86791.1 hypothetical protein GCM10025868_20410 [Angustibacter aerolatus]
MLDEDSASSMCYTSGTTGNPKGVVYSHRSNYLHAMQTNMGSAMGLKQGDRMLAIVPLFHANAWGLPYGALLSGASLIMPDRYLQAEPLVAMIAAERATTSAAVPTIWTAVLHHLDEHGGDVSSLQSTVIGGSACPPALMRAFQERYDIEVIHAWGMTETSPLGSVCIPPTQSEGEERWRYRESQGRISPLVQTRVVGPLGDEVPWDDESVGEIEVAGPWITGSYYREDAPEKFDDGWLRTGDVGSMTPDGYLRLTDRVKDVIKSGGEWIRLRRPRERPHVPPQGARGQRRRRPRREVGRAPPRHRRRRRGRVRRRRGACAPTSPTRSPNGRSPSAGPSSTRSPRRAWASSTRRSFVSGTRTGSVGHHALTFRRAARGGPAHVRKTDGRPVREA